MPRDSEARDRDEVLRSVEQQTQRTSRACSLLFQAWMQTGSEAIVGSTRIMADTLQDLNDLYCNPRGGKDRQAADEDKAK